MGPLSSQPSLSEVAGEERGEGNMGMEPDAGVVGLQGREFGKPLEEARAKGMDSPPGALRRAWSCPHFDFSSVRLLWDLFPLEL